VDDIKWGLVVWGDEVDYGGMVYNYEDVVSDIMGV